MRHYVAGYHPTTGLEEMRVEVDSSLVQSGRIISLDSDDGGGVGCYAISWWKASLLAPDQDLPDFLDYYMEGGQ